MMNRKRTIRNAVKIWLLCSICLSMHAVARDDVVDFESERWIMKNAEIVDHLGRKGLIGYAYLKDVAFENGVIQVDIAVDGTRSYPGIIFRIQDENNYERVYIRPHRADLYPDAIQYTPVINGIAGWQLHNGTGSTAVASIPENTWFHLKMEIKGKQARVFLDQSDTPALVITNLKHGISKGSIGLFSARDKKACFSNFQYAMDNNLQFEPAPEIETPPGMITEWELSRPFLLSQIDIERYPGEEMPGDMGWQAVHSEPAGLVDVSRYYGRTGREPDCVFARVMMPSNGNEVKKLLFGYSDAISIFLNGNHLFLGNSAYQQRDPSFLGIVGLNDTVYLPLKEGDNELLLIIAEAFGGWGFMCQDGHAVFEQKGMTKAWATEKAFLTPESIIFDPSREVFYVSNFDAYNKSPMEERQFISRVSRDGTIEQLKWITGLSKPTGMAVWENKLFVVERAHVAEIDLETGQIAGRHAVPRPMFLNDIAIDRSGNLYVSDSGKHVIYRFSDDKWEEWVQGDEIGNPNGLLVHDNALILGNNRDHRLKAVDLENKKISSIANLRGGVIDGIKVDENGNYLVSHWEGRIYRVTPSGEVTKLLDTSVPGLYCADFDYIPEKNFFAIPTFFENSIMAYHLKNE